MSCSSVKTVRLRRPFLALPPGSGGPGSSLPRRCSSSGRWGEAEPPCSPEPAASSAEPSPEQPKGASGNLNTAAGSAFSTAAGERGTRQYRAAPPLLIPARPSGTPGAAGCLGSPGDQTQQGAPGPSPPCTATAERSRPPSPPRRGCANTGTVPPGSTASTAQGHVSPFNGQLLIKGITWERGVTSGNSLN